MIDGIQKLNYTVGKIRGIYHDESIENQEKADQFLMFLSEHPELEGTPRSPFIFSILRDSIVSSFLNGGGSSLEDMIWEKAPFLTDYPEQFENLLAISTNDLNETLKHR